jgi:hypothetical protein
VREDTSYRGYVCCPTAGDTVRGGRAVETARLDALGGGSGGSYAFEVFGLYTAADGVGGAGTDGVVFGTVAYDVWSELGKAYELLVFEVTW